MKERQKEKRRIRNRNGKREIDNYNYVIMSIRSIKNCNDYKYYIYNHNFPRVKFINIIFSVYLENNKRMCI